MMINKIFRYVLFVGTVGLVGCEDFLEPDVSPDRVYSETAFNSEETALAALNGIYADFMISSSPVYVMNGSLGVIGGLVSDELYDFSQTYLTYDVNEIQPTGFGPTYYSWSNTYTHIYTANAIIEGVENSGLSEEVKDQILGEAYFIRGLLHFHLVNLYGNVPIITGTLYTENASKGQSSPEEVYDQIFSDLEEAESLLTEEYPSEGKVRPNEYVVQALLSRVHLYQENWTQAEEYATEVISGPYTLGEDLDQVFTISSESAIWQLIPSNPNTGNVNPENWFTPGATPTYTLTEELLEAFEEGDDRLEAWVGEFEYEGEVYYYPAKYVSTGTEPEHYDAVIRLAEIYLIRAEARAMLDDLEGAISDLDMVRTRHGGLEGYDGPETREAILDAILQERQVELFSEWGHRWFDLKRTENANEVLGAINPETWEATDVLWPIPAAELEANTNLVPNPGY